VGLKKGKPLTALVSKVFLVLKRQLRELINIYFLHCFYNLECLQIYKGH
jgi:hypothetical protein